MSLVGQLKTDVEIKASAAKFHEVFTCRPHHLPKVCPDVIQGVDLHEGDWGKKSSVNLWNYVHDGKSEVAKGIIEDIDNEKNSIIIKVVEGHLLEKYKNFHAIIQATPKDDGGSVIHWTIKYEKLNKDVPDPNALIESANNLIKGIEKHLTQA